MDSSEQEKELTKAALRKIEEIYGFIPPVLQIMSRRPDIFLPYSNLSKSLLLDPKFLDQKTTELAAVCAASALASEHCIGVHIQQAAKFGASKEEIFESIMLGTMMAMIQGQSQALRKFKEFEPEIDKHSK